ncbi:hypothetical protein ZWY2020_029145 [Hordeum vulgare]|nr:hypothetical protein ZWY2020_029145 [Hordeum vulgare]
MVKPADVLGLTPGYKPEPLDDELVEYYLLRRLQAQRVPLEGIILEDYLLRAPPWELLNKHDREDDAFFFAHGQTIHDSGSRWNKRTCDGGGGYGKKRKREPDEHGEDDGGARAATRQAISEGSDLDLLEEHISAWRSVFPQDQDGYGNAVNETDGSSQDYARSWFLPAGDLAVGSAAATSDQDASAGVMHEVAGVDGVLLRR